MRVHNSDLLTPRQQLQEYDRHFVVLTEEERIAAVEHSLANILSCFDDTVPLDTLATIALDLAALTDVTADFNSQRAMAVAKNAVALREVKQNG